MMLALIAIYIVEPFTAISLLQERYMELERLEELVVLAAALAVGVLLAIVNPDRMPERMRSWALSLGKFRQPLGIGIVVAVVALALLFR